MLKTVIFMFFQKRKYKFVTAKLKTCLKSKCFLYLNIKNMLYAITVFYSRKHKLKRTYGNDINYFDALIASFMLMFFKSFSTDFLSFSNIFT